MKGLHLNLDRAGSWIAPLSLRVFLAWEFFESGLEKFNGENWFADIQDRFLFPFNHLPATLNWELSMWVELICALALSAVYGPGTPQNGSPINPLPVAGQSPDAGGDGFFNAEFEEVKDNK